MKKFTKNRKIIPVSLIIMLLTGFNAINLNAQEISFTFTANHTCKYAALDSILIENLTQGGDTTLYYPDTVLTLVLTGIDQFLTGSNNFYVSQNYPNPFETKTNIDIFLPECDDITIDVYDLLGRKVVNYEGSHESGMQHFTFFGGNSKNYILTVSSKKYLQYIQMIQFGEVSSGLPYLEYNGSTTMNSIKIKQKSLQSLFPYNLGDQLKFTGYVSGDYISITDNPTTSQEYIFDINHMVPTTPTAGTHITDEDQIEWHWNTVADADGYKYNAVNDYTSATDNGTSTSYTQTGLACETNYTLYVWAYNSCGTSSSLELNEQTSDCPSSFICGTSTVTYDGVTYNTVQIGSQCWLKENLRTTKYNDNSSIPEVTDASTWTSTTSGAYCCYDNNPSNCDTYGALYNWYAVNTGKLCPSGWHVPSDAEWDTLTNYLSANSQYWCGSNSSYIAKSLASTTLWNTHTGTCTVGNDLSANNSTGFSALPGGYRNSSDGSFYYLSYYGYWWSSTENGASYAWFRSLNYNNANASRSSFNKRFGLSVRCLRD
jgi:uncharacterized protein (TIGR02145 family)